MFDELGRINTYGCDLSSGTNRIAGVQRAEEHSSVFIHFLNTCPQSDRLVHGSGFEEFDFQRGSYMHDVVSVSSLVCYCIGCTCGMTINERGGDSSVQRIRRAG